MTALYVPGVEETDIKKVIRALQNVASATTANTTATSALRQVLSGNATYYVRTDGSDSNTGLANTAGGAFLTIQKAIDTVAALDISSYNVTINVADGTYTTGIVVDGPWIGKGTVTVTGNATTPANCVISSGTGTCITVNNFGRLSFGGFRLTGGIAVSLNFYSIVHVTSPCEFVTLSTGGFFVFGGSQCYIDTPNLYVGGSLGTVFLDVFGGGSLWEPDVNCAVTWLSNTTTSIFIICKDQGFAFLQGITWTVGAFGNTGQRYACLNGGIINTAGAGINYIPGTVAGTGTDTSVTPWGLYT